MDKKQVPRSILSIAISTIMVLGNYLPYLGSIDVLAATDGMIAGEDGKWISFKK